MYSRIEIEGFRGLRHLNIPDLAPITLLTGRNNVGKTSVLEALLLHAAGPRAGQFILAALRPYRGTGALSLELNRYSTPWETIFFNRDTSAPVRLTAELDGRRVGVQFSVPHGDLDASIPTRLTASTAAVASDTPYSYSLEIEIESEAGPGEEPRRRVITQRLSPQPIGPVMSGIGTFQQPIGLALESIPPSDVAPLALAFLVSPQNRSPQNELAKRYSDLRIREAQQQFLDAMRAIEPAVERIELLVSGGQPTLYLSMADSPPLPLSILGEGMNAVANYATSILEATGGTVLIDEVENGIHYSVLENLWQQIGRSVKETNAQVIASTHSAECVSAAYRALRHEPDLLRVMRLRPGTTSPAATSVASYDIDALEGAIDQNLDVR